MAYNARKITKHWLRSAITGSMYGRPLCPFARKYLDEGRIRVKAISEKDWEGVVDRARDEIDLLLRQDQDVAPPETTLIVLTGPLRKAPYWDFVRTSWKIMDAIDNNDGWREKVQVVNFHPEGKHSLYAEETRVSFENGEGEDWNCLKRKGVNLCVNSTTHMNVIHTTLSPKHAKPSDFTIRSPLPTYHLLKEDTIMAELTGGYVKSPETIPDRNARMLDRLGLKGCEKKFLEMSPGKII